MSELKITSGQEWTPELIEAAYNEIETIAHEDFDLDVYPNQLEIVNFEQMLDAYVSVGMPVYYSHWSFGEQFVKQHDAYKRGMMGLAYELVINSKPCISYLMEENTMLTQALVIAHAAFGHNFFFKQNYLFKQWTDPEGIIDYLVFSKKFIQDCEEKYGADEVEAVLDAAHALQPHGVDKYRKPDALSAAQEEALRKEREEWQHQHLNDIWSTVPRRQDSVEGESQPNFPADPEENILYFIEKNAPRMEEWKREILRIVRKIAQYFYPQGQTQVMNEGCASYFHYKIIHRLHEKGFLDDGAMMEFYSMHSNVLFQPEYTDQRYSGINPYALGFAIFKDIERVALDPTEEDLEFFGKQSWVGSGDYVNAIQWAVKNFKDDSFIQQFLSPKVIRDFRLFAVHDDDRDEKLLVSGIHNKQGYATVRSAISRMYNRGFQIPDIQVHNVDRWGDRTLELQHHMVSNRPIDPESTKKVLDHISFLWGYKVKLTSVAEDGSLRSMIETSDDGSGTRLDVFLDDA